MVCINMLLCAKQVRPLRGSSQFEIQVDIFDRIEDLDDERIGVCASRVVGSQDGDMHESHCACQLVVPDLAMTPRDWQTRLKAYLLYPLAIVLLVVLLTAHFMQDGKCKSQVNLAIFLAACKGRGKGS